MSLLKRLEKIERFIVSSTPPDAAIIVFWPPACEPGAEEARERIRCDVQAHKEAGRKVIEFHVIDAAM